MIRRCLIANGCDDANADAITDNMASAEASGSASHGMFRLPGYVASLRSGKADGKAVPEIKQIAPGVIRADNKHGYAPLAIEQSRAPFVELVKSQGIAALSINNSHHFAVLWIEVERIVEQGLCAMAMTCHLPYVAPTGGSKPFFSTNPISFGWPRKKEPPMVFDMATAEMARGEIMLAARDGHAVPESAGVDSDGNPTTDPNKILEGAQSPFGGYKGSAIAMMIELLACGLIGDLFSYETALEDNGDGGPARGGELIIAMDPKRFGAEDYLEHTDRFFSELTSQPGLRLPGDRRYKTRAETASAGVNIPRALHEKVIELTG